MAKFRNYDDYISKCQPFAQPILKYIRECVHEAGNDIKEDFKWSFPNYTYKGQILCHMAGFKEHVAFGFWLGNQMKDPKGIFQTEGNSGMGQFGKIRSMNDLPDKKVFIDYIRQAIALTDEGKKTSTGKKKEAKVKKIPELLSQALKSNPAAQAHFNEFSNSKRNEYAEWVDEAKTEATKIKRVQQSIEWISEGKPRNWKYMKKW